MNLTPLGTYSYAGFMYQPGLEAHNPNPPLPLGEWVYAAYMNLSVFVTEEVPVLYLYMLPSADFQYDDTATIYIDLSVLGGECFSTYTGNLLGEGEAEGNWYSSLDEARWLGSELTRWSEGEVIIEGIHC
jgi:hypothetical protein